MFADIRQYVELTSTNGLDTWTEEYLGHGSAPKMDSWATEYLGQNLNQQYPSGSQFQFICGVSSTGNVSCPSG
eukprot:750072-Hanusia_phi.AAC.2